MAQQITEFGRDGRPATPDGGLVVTARIVYDLDANGLFQDPSAAGSNLASTDEAYNAVLYVGNVTLPGSGCPI